MSVVKIGAGDNAIDEFVERIRSKLSDEQIREQWDQNIWKLGKYAVSFAKQGAEPRRITQENLMEQPFLEFARAFIAETRNRGSKGYPKQIYGLRTIEMVLREVFPGVAPNPASVNHNVLDRTVELCQQCFTTDVAAQAGRSLQEIAVLLGSLTGSTVGSWKNPLRRSTDYRVRTSEEAAKRRKEKLPAPSALDAIADIFFSTDRSTRDTVTTCVIALLCCAPFRISEILLLAEDCEDFIKGADGTEAYGIKVFDAKTSIKMTKIVPTVMVPVAKEAIRRIRALTGEARRIAKWLESNPSTFYRHPACPHVPENQSLTISEAAAALGIDYSVDQYRRVRLRALGLSGASGGETLASLTKWCMDPSQLPTYFPYVDYEKTIKFSEAMFVAQGRMLRADTNGYSPVTIEAISYASIHTDLETQAGRDKKSIFERRGFNVGRDEPLKITSNQLRHWLNNIAQRGGLPDEDIARWSGRTHVRQNEYYDHVAPDEYVERAKALGVGNAQLHEALEVANFIRQNKPVSLKEIVNSAKRPGHLTSCGKCNLDWAQAPCSKFLNCLDCTLHVCITGDPRKEVLRKIAEETEKDIELAEEEVREGTFGADVWLITKRRTLERARAILAIQDDPAIEPGRLIVSLVKDEFSPTMRALEKSKQMPPPLGILLTANTSAAELGDVKAIVLAGDSNSVYGDLTEAIKHESSDG